MFREKMPDGSTRLTGAALTLDDVLEALNPIGKIYISVDSTDPGDLFGGTWVSWGTGRVPVGVDTGQVEFDTVEETGGAKTVTLTTGNLAGHTHSMPNHNHSTPNHHHSIDIEYSVGTMIGGGSTRVVDAGGATGVGGNTAFGDTTTGGGGTTGSDGAGNTGSTGAADPVNKLPPYITCYMWKRTA